MDTPHPVRGSLADAAFSFQCDAAELATYANMHLASVATEDRVEPAVSAVLSWHDGQPPRRRPPDPSEVAGMERIDRDVYIGDHRLSWFRVDDMRDLFLRFTHTDDRLSIHGDFYYRLGNRWLSDRIRRIVQWRHRHALRQRRFPTLLSYLVYYPCWWWLEQYRDFHPIHAAGVLTDAGVILLAGASGVGKSTLAVALATSPGARLLSDSFVLHHDTEVRAVPEPVLLDARSRQWLGSSEDLRPMGRRYGLNREGYQLPAQRLVAGGSAALLVFLRRAWDTAIRRLTPDEASQRMSAADLIINDLRRYWAFGAIMEQLVPGGLMTRREAHIASLTSGVPCYELSMSPATPRAAVVGSILELVEGTHLRAVGARQ